MSFLRKLFGKAKEKKVGPNTTQVSKDEPSPIQIIEKELGILFPSKFKQFVTDKLPLDNTIKIELLDGSYKFLDSLFRKDITDHYENVINISNDFNAYVYPEEKDFVKIPFARSTEGDGFKYLYFVAEKENEASERILLRDMDSPATGRIGLTDQLPFIFRKVGKVDNHIVVSNTTLNFSEANNWIEIPEFIHIWKNSYVTNIAKSAKDNYCIIDLYLLNYISSEDKEENISKIEVQVEMSYKNNRIDSAMSFEIDKSGLQTQFSNNVNYRIFYHKLVCIIGTLATLAADLKNNHEIEIVEFFNTLDLQELVKQDFKGKQEQYM